MEEIQALFPKLTPLQLEQLTALGPLYTEWNQKINVISRKDIENIYTRHVLHSLVLERFVKFIPGTKVIDLGTGGGFPGIPLAIMFPETHFYLIDGTNKKLNVVRAIVEALDLKNVTVQHVRAEEFKGKVDFVVTRAVAKLDKLTFYADRLIDEKQRNALPNGLLAYKGGNVKAEIAALGRGAYAEIYPLKKLSKDPWFDEKCIVYVQW